MSPTEPSKPSAPAHGAVTSSSAPAPAPQSRTPEEIALDFVDTICSRFGNPPDLEALRAEFVAALPPPTTRSEEKPRS